MFIFKKKYNVNYHGYKNIFSNALDSYYPGDKVQLFCNEFSNNTDYEFDVTDVENTVSFDPRSGYLVEFTMPDHDVEIIIIEEKDVEKHHSFEEDKD